MKTLGAVGGAVGMSGFAAVLSACCFSPIAVTLLGVSGAVALARLAFLQPYLLAAGVALMALAFWRAYRVVPAAQADVCDPVANRRTRRIVWLAAVVMAALAITSLVPLYFSFT